MLSNTVISSAHMNLPYECLRMQKLVFFESIFIHLLQLPETIIKKDIEELSLHIHSVLQVPPT